MVSAPPAELKSASGKAPTSGARMTRRRLLKLGALSGAAGLAAHWYGRYYEVDRLTLEQVAISSRALPQGVKLRIGLLSDIHCDDEHCARRVRRSVEMTLSQNPDVVFITGDYTTARFDKLMDMAADSLSRASTAPLGAYAVLGNHDGIGRKAAWITRELSLVGIRVLRNQVEPLTRDHRLWVVGVGSHSMGQASVDTCLRRLPKGVSPILLAHEPDYADLCPPGIALQLSGHSHGGQIRLPGVGPLHTPRHARKYIEGLIQTPNHPLYVTRGVGVVGPRYRLFCPPEVTLIELTGAA